MRQEDLEPRHSKPQKPKHYRKESKKPKILKAIIAVELVLVILANMDIYWIWCHNFEVRIFRQISEVTLQSAAGCADNELNKAVRTYLEGVSEEVDEYAFTTAKVKYRKGPASSYKSAGTFEKDKMVKRTAIMNNGWSRITLDDKEYYVPNGKMSTDIPESIPIAGGAKGDYQRYALYLMPEFGWEASELEPLIYLWERESHWNPKSHNKRSGAHGIPQALPAKRMASEGKDYYSNGYTQIRWGLKYIAGRYGSPSAAWAHSQATGWY